jgi:gluconate 2-dehydrogenase gamma chain
MDRHRLSGQADGGPFEERDDPAREAAADHDRGKGVREGADASGNGISRRALIARGGATLGGIVVAGVGAPSVVGTSAAAAAGPVAEAAADHASPNPPPVPLRFFSFEDANVIGAMADRIFPKDHHGPGATGLGVVTYIDGQLAGAWGSGERMYRSGPFFAPTDSGHGWQYAMTPGDAYRVGLDSLGSYTTRKYRGKTFDELAPAQQDKVLTELSLDKVPTFTQITGSDFFAMFLQNVKEGIFADPLYGGNRGVEGWKLIRFPGDPMSRGDNNFKFVTDYSYYPPGPPLPMVIE